MKKHVLLALLCLATLVVRTQELPRRVFLGIRMENLSSDARNLLGLNEPRGILITEVLPNSTAEKAGFLKGDILLAINGKDIPDIDGILALLAGQKPQSTFNYELFRDKRTLHGKARFTSFPQEHYNGLEVSYTSSSTINGLQRTIITRPPSISGAPVIAFIGGIGCYSLDSPFDSTRNEIQLLNKLARQGYLCARLEKPGTGDATGYSTPCGEVGFMDEVAGYVQMIRDLKSRPGVDSNRVYILGHSMGGVMAPLIARQTPVAGIIAYGTIGSNFQEYLMKTRRTIGYAMNMEPEAIDDLVRNFCECAHYYFAERKTTTEAAELNPDCAEYLPVFDLRSRTYNNELYALNIPAGWKPYEGRALLLWGTADYIASREDHEIIAATVNRYHKGHAVFREVPGSDHGWNSASDPVEAAGNPGPYNRSAERIILDWLASQK